MLRIFEGIDIFMKKYQKDLDEDIFKDIFQAFSVYFPCTFRPKENDPTFSGSAPTILADRLNHILSLDACLIPLIYSCVIEKLEEEEEEQNDSIAASYSIQLLNVSMEKYGLKAFDGKAIKTFETILTTFTTTNLQFFEVFSNVYAVSTKDDFQSLTKYFRVPLTNDLKTFQYLDVVRHLAMGSLQLHNIICNFHFPNLFSKVCTVS